MAIDGSTELVGWAIFEGRKRIDSGTYKSVSGDIEKRMESIRFFIDSQIKLYGVHDLILEDIHLTYRNRLPQVHVYRALAMIRGVLCVVAVQNKCDIYFLIPNEWRSELSIKCGGRNTREDSKSSALEYISQFTKREIGIDEAEALAIMMSFIQHHNRENS